MLTLEEIKCLYADAFLRWVEAVSWAFDSEKERASYLIRIQNYIFVLENYEDCGFDKHLVKCKLDSLKKDYMSSCKDKLNQTQVINVFQKLWATGEFLPVIEDDARHTNDEDSSVGISLTWSNTGATYTPTITMYNKVWTDAVFGTTPAGTYAYVTNYSTSVKSRKIFTGDIQTKGRLSDLGINFSTVTVNNWFPIGFIGGTDFPSADKFIEGSVHAVSGALIKSSFIIRTTGYIDVRFTLLSGSYPSGANILSGENLSFDGLIFA